MPAKKKRQAAQADIQRGLAAHEAASRRAHEWAARCLAYRDADEPVLAKNAEQKARHWLRKAILLETKTSGGSRLVNRI
jgi:hypothetical protein